MGKVRKSEREEKALPNKNSTTFFLEILIRYMHHLNCFGIFTEARNIFALLGIGQAQHSLQPLPFSWSREGEIERESSMRI